MILPSSAAYTKVHELWYEDGNVILEAEDTLFRVPTIILANTSRVFRELFLLADAPDAETYECCPLIHLIDRAIDMTYFIKALLDPRCALLVTRRPDWCILIVQQRECLTLLLASLIRPMSPTSSSFRLCFG